MDILNEKLCGAYLFSGAAGYLKINNVPQKENPHVLDARWPSHFEKWGAGIQTALESSEERSPKPRGLRAPKSEVRNNAWRPRGSGGGSARTFLVTCGAMYRTQAHPLRLTPHGTALRSFRLR